MIGLFPLAVSAVAALVQLHQVLGPSGVIVDAAPDVSSCPAPDQVRAAITRQRGGRGEDAVTGWTVRYASKGSDALTVEVMDPSGVVRARRKVTADRARAEACAVAAETVAAIGVRAFQPVEWTSGERPDLPAPSPPSSPPPAIASSPAPVATGSERSRSRLTLAVGPAFVSAPGAGVNIGIDAGVLIKGPVALRAGGFLLPAHQQERASLAGTANLTRVSLWSGLTWVGQRRGVGFEAGPALGVSLDSARTDGISQPSAGHRVVLAGGLLAGLGWPVDSRWHIGIVAALLGRLAASEFSVTTDAGDALVLHAPALTAFAALRAQWTLLP